MILLVGLIYAAYLALNQPIPEVIYQFSIFMGVVSSLNLILSFPILIFRLFTKRYVSIRAFIFNVLASIVVIMGSYILSGSCGSTWFEVDIDSFAFGLILIIFGAIYEFTWCDKRPFIRGSIL